MDHAKYFGPNNVALENDLRRVAHEQKIQLRPLRLNSARDAYYPQITERIRHDAAVMAQHYKLFYCLETSIRDVIRARLIEHGCAARGQRIFKQPLVQVADDRGTRAN